MAHKPSLITSPFAIVQLEPTGEKILVGEGIEVLKFPEQEYLEKKNLSKSNHCVVIGTWFYRDCLLSPNITVKQFQVNSLSIQISK